MALRIFDNAPSNGDAPGAARDIMHENGHDPHYRSQYNVFVQAPSKAAAAEALRETDGPRGVYPPSRLRVAMGNTADALAASGIFGDSIRALVVAPRPNEEMHNGRVVHSVYDISTGERVGFLCYDENHKLVFVTGE